MGCVENNRDLSARVRLGTRVLGGAEALAGGALVVVSALSPELGSLRVPAYVLGGSMAASGGAELISGRVNYLLEVIEDLYSGIAHRRQEKIAKSEEGFY